MKMQSCRVPSLLTTVLALSVLLLPLGAVAAGLNPAAKADKMFLAEVVNAIHKKDLDWIAGHMFIHFRLLRAMGHAL
jgi:hypothetical protein